MDYALSFSEVMVKVHVVDLKSETITTPVSVRAYLNQTITEFKQLIAQVDFFRAPHVDTNIFFLSQSIMHLLDSTRQTWDCGGSGVEWPTGNRKVAS